MARAWVEEKPCRKQAAAASATAGQLAGLRPRRQAQSGAAGPRRRRWAPPPPPGPPPPPPPAPPGAPAILKISSRSWNCPCVSPTTTTGALT
jgi:hypothetical protein